MLKERRGKQSEKAKGKKKAEAKQKIKCLLFYLPL
jgi:hypothetical protein